MPSQVLTTVENNFTKGLMTEFTGMNFPENAATDTDNCIYTLIGDVTRRGGIDNETNYSLNAVNRSGMAISSYKWNNASGDGLSQIVVEQVGGTLYFYLSSSASTTSPVSAQLIASTVTISSFTAVGGSFDPTVECQFADGNGYLFVFHPDCDPFYCIYGVGSITATAITVQIRDLAGISEANVADNFRPATLTDDHKYNLINQGWIAGNPWSASSVTSASFTTGAKTFTIATGLTGIAAGQSIRVIDTTPYNTFGIITYSNNTLYGTVTSYTSGTGALVVSITSYTFSAYVLPYSTPSNNPNSNWGIVPITIGYVNTWNSAIGNYPSNADQWWSFKNTSNVFDPATTQANTSIGSGPAPKGSIILNAFQQLRAAASGISTITDVTTTVRPKTGCWFQGRVWYTGVDASFEAAGDQPFSSWTESIYFSQVIQNTSQFGKCYQQNDLTSEILFDLLPTDGGVIKIQGCGSIYKLFPLMNAMLIFAANGVWYITGSQGIGFSANDYTIVKLSSVKSISCTSFVDIQGLPMFWNEEGIYTVEPAKQGQGLLNSPLHVNPLEVNALTVGTILSFYNNIPIQSKKYVRGVYDPINYIVQWIYKSTNETSVTDRYTYDRILNFNNHNKAFFPYSINITTNNPPSINSIVYVTSPGGVGTSESVIKYVASVGSNMTFAEENDFTTYTDWTSTVKNNYNSYFITGFKLHGQGQRRFQIPYIYVFSRLGEAVAYKIQGIWDYANNRNSNRWSVAQLVNINSPNYDSTARRHKIRGRGLVLQIKVSSVDGMPFDVMGWSVYENQNASV